MKIIIIGYSGAGKSTLAKELGRLCHSPVLHLDQVNFIANWEIREKQEALALVQEFMQRDSWIIDGNYINLYQEQRFQDADLIICFQYNRFLCLYQVFRRFCQFHGKVRDTAAPGCNEKLDWEFIRWILHDGRNRQRKAHYRQIATTYSEKFIALKNRKDTSLFLANFQKEQQN